MGGTTSISPDRAGDYTRTTLGKLIESGQGFIQTGPFGSQLHARDYVDDGIPVVMPQQLGDNEIHTDGIAYIRERDRDRLSRHVMRKGDIVFSRRGDVTRRAYIDAKEEGWLCGTGCLLLRLEHPECDNRYLVRLLGLHDTRSYLTQRAIGATMPNLNQAILASVPVTLLPRKHQERIVDVLSAYDDLIENNRRRIQLLEQAARLLYKEWFVRLRFPGHEHVKVKDGVPEGWEKKPLGEFAPLNYGKALKKDHRAPGPFPVFGSSGVVGTHEKALVPGPAIIVGRKGNAGSVHWSQDDFYPIDTVYFIEAKHCSIYLYYALLHTQFINTDVAVPGLNRDFAHSRLLLLPDNQILALFEQHTTTIYEQMNRLEKYSQELAKARDLLLPRLMNGEVAI